MCCVHGQCDVSCLHKVAMIFGVTGQDGSYLAELLLDKSYVVVGVARRTSTDNTERVKHLLTNDMFKLVQGDVTDFSSIMSLLIKFRPTEVYNLAAQSHVSTSFEQPNTTWDVTAKGALNILEAIRLFDTERNMRFYQASSSEMFGDAYTEGPSFEYTENKYSFFSTMGNKVAVRYQDEDTEMNPQSPYAIAKLSAHKTTQLYRKAYGMYTASGILFNHESERRGELFVTRKISKYVGSLRRDYMDRGKSLDEAPKLHLGNLDASRDWGHAEDYVRAMWLMLQQTHGDDYVISTGKTYKVSDFVVEAFKVIGVDNWERFVVVDKSFMRPAEVPYLRGFSRKAKTLLGWKPEVSFNSLVRRMVENDSRY